MVDKHIGFRPEFLSMNNEFSPTSSEDFLQTERQKATKNYITFDFGCSWQFVNAAGPYPEGMVRGGVDADGTVIYIGRAFHLGDMLPAKVMPDKNECYVCHGGEEHAKEDFEVLRSGNFVWEFASSGTIPEGGVACGATADGEQLFIGRALYQGTQTPGKVQVSHGCLYIPFAGAEVSVTEYEVLCLK